MNRIAEARREANLTQKDLEKVTGIDRSYISSLENERVIPHLRTMRKLAKALGKTMDELFPEEAAA